MCSVLFVSENIGKRNIKLAFNVHSSTCKSEHAPEHLQQGLVHEPVDVLGMVVSLVSALALFLGLTRVDALQDAQAPACQAGSHLVHTPQAGCEST